MRNEAMGVICEKPRRVARSPRHPRIVLTVENTLKTEDPLKTENTENERR